MEIKNHTIVSGFTVNSLVDGTTLGKKQCLICPGYSEGSCSKRPFGKKGMLKVTLPSDFSREAFIIDTRNNSRVPKGEKESLLAAHLISVHFHVPGHPADSPCTGPVSHKSMDPGSFFIIPNPDRDRPSLLKIGSRCHDEKLVGIGKQTSILVTGKRH